MEEEEFKKVLECELKRIGENIGEEEEGRLYQYMHILMEWNKKINLTAIVEEKEIIVKHFVDSLTIKREIKKEDYVLDLGTGAGFPGIPLKIANSTNKMLLMDSLNKRIQFLNTEVIEKLGLQNILAIHGRAEEMARKKEYREKFDVVTSRAVATLSVLMEYMLPFTKIGGKCICMKGPKIEEEIEQAEKAIKLFGGRIETIKSFKIGENNIRKVAIIRKEKATPPKFPRKAGIPAREPII